MDVKKGATGMAMLSAWFVKKDAPGMAMLSALSVNGRASSSEYGLDRAPFFVDNGFQAWNELAN
jgi:hypothetical protein